MAHVLYLVIISPQHMDFLLLSKSLFSTYLQLGFRHISDLNAYDHIVFIIALCAIYRLRQWRQLLILVTAFTLGHSISLALAVLDIAQFPARMIELLIPLTIMGASIYNVLPAVASNSRRMRFHYYLALFFGLIHGMGFSNFLRASLLPGDGSELWQQLLAFNIGIELGQLGILIAILGVSYMLLDKLKLPPTLWNQFVSGAAFGIGLVLLLEQC